SIAVTERRKEIGILRALGATRGQIRNLFLSEGAAAGLLGSLAGVSAGILIAKGLSRYVSGLLVDIYSVGERSDEITVEPGLLAWALAIGVSTSILASFLPARSAARVDPVQALQKGGVQVLSAGENRIRRWLAVSLVAVCVACVTLGRSRPVFYAGFLSVIAASLLLTQSLSLRMARVLRPVLQWIRPIEGALAADSLIQAPRRMSATVTALMMSLAMVIALNGLAIASYDSIVEWLDSTFNPDLFVNTNQTLGARSFHFPAVIGEQLAGIDGIATVQGVRTLRVTFRGTPVLLVSGDLRSIARHTVNPRTVAGDYQEMHRLAGEGKGAIVAENLAMLHNLGLGHEVEIAAPGGALRLPVVGILRDFSDQQGTVFIDRSIYLKYWNDSTVDIFRIYLSKGTSAEVVKRRIQERFAGERRLFVLLNTEIKDYVLRLTDQWFAMTHVQTAVAVLVAILGIVNTLTVSISDRRREIGVLRAVGALSAQVRRTIWMEALAVAFIGLVLGLLLGAVNLYYQLDIVQRDISGLVVAYRFPFMASLWLVPVMLGSAFLAALWPGEAAVRSGLVEALEYE
ncbi:MAG: FtsX-like permease family protein, partial [Bryobacterales bacterium]|nr:FtsX-like permease family protein [Bryobacterales bacterium]